MPMGNWGADQIILLFVGLLIVVPLVLGIMLWRLGADQDRFLSPIFWIFVVLMPTTPLFGMSVAQWADGETVSLVDPISWAAIAVLWALGTACYAGGYLRARNKRHATEPASG